MQVQIRLRSRVRSALVRPTILKFVLSVIHWSSPMARTLRFAEYDDTEELHVVRAAAVPPGGGQVKIAVRSAGETVAPTRGGDQRHRPRTPAPRRRQPVTRSGQMSRMQRTVILTMSARAVFAATTIGQAPLAVANGKSLPTVVCMGPEIYLGQCDSRVPLVNSVKILVPKWRVRTYPDTACVRSAIPPKQPELAERQLFWPRLRLSQP